MLISDCVCVGGLDPGAGSPEMSSTRVYLFVLVPGVGPPETSSA